MSKKMKANDIINIAKQEYSFKKILVTASTGQEFEVQIQEKLNDTKVSELVVSLIERGEYCDKNNIEFNVIQNIYLMLIKYFTDIKFNTYDTFEKTYSNEIAMMNALVDLGILTQITKQFNQESLTKIQNMFKEYENQLKPLVNDEVKNMLKADEI